MWIWVLENGLTPEAAVNTSLYLGLTGIIVKAFDGSRTGLFMEQFKAIAPLAKKAGLVLGAWGYSYGRNIPGEVRAALEAIAEGADWLVIDAEGEYENPAGKEAAMELGKQLLRTSQGVPVTYSTFALPEYHPNFPYAEFSQFTQACLPQIYWRLMSTSVESAVISSVKSLKQFGEVAPVGQAFGNASPEEIAKFARLVKAMGLDSLSFWELSQASRDQLEAIARIPAGNYAEVSPWARNSWRKAVELGLMENSNPAGVVTREMLAVILDRAGLLKREG